MRSTLTVCRTRIASVSRSVRTPHLLSLGSTLAPSQSALTLTLTLPTTAVTRTIHSTPNRCNSDPSPRPAVTTFSDDENELREMVAKFARETVKPKVNQMDEQGSDKQQTITHAQKR